MNIPLHQSHAQPLTERAILRCVYHLDEPIADASVLPLWLILDGASKVGTRFLSGHGADELLGGYPRYHFLQKTKGAHGLVPVNILSALLPALPPNAFIRRASRYLTRIHDDISALLSLAAVFDEGEREELYTDTAKASIHDQGGSAAIMGPYFTGRDLTQNLMAFDLSATLPCFLLAPCDRLAAAHGISLRFPFLDDALVDFALTLPPRTKFGVRSKPLLRQAMKGILPPKVRIRARRGFQIPQEGRVMRVIHGLRDQVITPERVESVGLFRWRYVERIMNSASDNIYRRRQFWALLMFFAWYREVME